MPRRSKCKQGATIEKAVTHDAANVLAAGSEDNVPSSASASVEPAITDRLPSDLAEGDFVRLHGLVSAAHLNGLCGEVMRLQDDRAQVNLGLKHGCKSVAMKNLEISASIAKSDVSETELLAKSSASGCGSAAAAGCQDCPKLFDGALVEAHGLATAAHMNGLCGTIAQLQGDRAHVNFDMPYGIKSLDTKNLSLASAQMQDAWQEKQLSLEKHPIEQELLKVCGADAERLFIRSGGVMPSGMCVCLPEGRWACRLEPITSGCHLLGTSIHGNPKTILMGQIVINLSDPADIVVLEDIDFQMPAGANAVYCMQGTVHIRGCTITSRGPGVGIGGSQSRASLVMFNSKIQNCGEGGIVAGGEQTICDITKCSFFGNRAGGVEVRQGASVLVRRTEFRSNGKQAILAWQKPGFVSAIECNCFDHAQESSILIAEGGTAKLERMFIAGSAMAAVAVENANLTLEKCVCENGLHGLLVQTGRCNVVARGSYFRQNRYHGVFIGYDAIGQVSISACTMSDNKKRGLEHCGRRKVCKLEVSDNVIQGNGQDGILGDFMSEGARKEAKDVPFDEILSEHAQKANIEKLRRELGLPEPFPGSDGLQAMRYEKARKQAGLSHGLPHCAGCGKAEPKNKKFSRCAGCQGVRYCSTSCQKHHWKDHKAQCKAAGKVAKCPSFKDPSKDVRDNKPEEPFFSRLA